MLRSLKKIIHASIFFNWLLLIAITGDAFNVGDILFPINQNEKNNSPSLTFLAANKNDLASKITFEPEQSNSKQISYYDEDSPSVEPIDSILSFTDLIIDKEKQISFDLQIVNTSIFIKNRTILI